MIEPDDDHDWINQGDKTFRKHMQRGNKKDKSATTVFENYSLGVCTNRDAWCYNFSKQNLTERTQSLVDFYNDCVDKFGGYAVKDSKEKISTDGILAWSISFPGEVGDKNEQWVQYYQNVTMQQQELFQNIEADEEDYE